jgi:aryl-alcohol dehydrogenase-like predicted oxidoreductase
MKLQLKRIDLNRTVFGIYRTTVRSTITTVEQLKENIDTIQVTLSEEVLKRLMQYKQQFQIQHRN